MPIATALRDKLEESGVSCWMAPWKIAPGVFWQTAIVNAIERECQLFVLLFSSNSSKSPEVFRELGLAANRLKIVPLVLGDVTPQSADGIDGFRYYLNQTHCVPFLPSKMDDACGLIVDALRRPETLSIPNSETPVSHETLVEVTRTIADEMVTQKQTAVEIGHLPAELQTKIAQVAGIGLLRECPSVTEPDSKFVTFALDAEENLNEDRFRIAEDALAGWISRNLDEGAPKLMARAVEFPLLADGIARYLGNLAKDAPAEARDLFQDFIGDDLPVVGRLVYATLKRVRGIDSELEKFARVTSETGKLNAQRGLLHVAQSFLVSNETTNADRLFGLLKDWCSERADDPEAARLTVEVDNERGRLLLARRQFASAESLFRDALAQARAIEDVESADVITNNLARAILESNLERGLPGDRFAEVELLLQENIRRLEKAGHLPQLGVSFSHLGKLFAKRDTDKAEEYLRKDVQISKGLDDRRILADALDNLGVFLCDQRRLDEAEQVHARELLLFEELFDLKRNARALANKGRCEFAAGYEAGPGDINRLQRARQTLTKAGDLFSSLREPALYAPTLENLGRVEYFLGFQGKGIDTLRKAAEQYRIVPDGRSNALRIERELEELQSGPVTRNWE